MLLHRITRQIFTGMGAFLIAAPVFAADNFNTRRHPHHGSHSQQISVGTNGLPSFLPRIGTYSGGISALRDRGNGNYFMTDTGRHLREPRSTRSGLQLAPKARIINVNVQTIGSECSYEHGVCVIRP